MGELSATHPISYDAGSWLRLTMERNDGQRSRTMNCFGATEKTSSKISVLLVDDHTMVRQGLRALLEAEEDLSVVGEAENGRQALQMVKRLQPDVVVMDIAMPALNGLDSRPLVKSASKIPNRKSSSSPPTTMMSMCSN